MKGPTLLWKKAKGLAGVSMTLFVDLKAQIALRCLVPWAVAHKVCLSMGFSRQEYWSG